MKIIFNGHIRGSLGGPGVPLIILALLFATAPVAAQLVNNGATIKVTDGAILKATADILNDSSGTIDNEGTVDCDGNLENKDGTLRGSGTYEVGGDFVNESDFQADTSTIVFDSATSSMTSGGDPAYRVHLLSAGNQTLTLIGDLEVMKELKFGGANKYVQLDTNDLVMGSGAEISGAGATSYVVTNSTGKLSKESLSSAFVFPVGFDNSTYNPITLTENGTADTKSVRCLEFALQNGLVGSQLTDAVFASWEVMESGAGGSNLDVEVRWNGSDEPASFDRSNSGIFLYDGSSWETDETQVDGAGGGDPYTQDRTGVNAVGVFAVGDGCILVDSLLVLMDPLPSNVYTADDLLVSDDDVNPDTSVTFVSNMEISLVAGFDAFEGSDFQAFIDDACGGVVLLEDPFTEGNDLYYQSGTLEQVPEQTELKSFHLMAMPNPFRDQTTLEYKLERQAQVSLLVFDGRGSLVKTILSNDVQNAGIYHVDMNTSRLGAGIYIALLKVDDEVKTLKLMKIQY